MIALAHLIAIALYLINPYKRQQPIGDHKLKDPRVQTGPLPLPPPQDGKIKEVFQMK